MPRCQRLLISGVAFQILVHPHRYPNRIAAVYGIIPAESVNSFLFPDLPVKSWAIHSDIPTVPPRSINIPASQELAAPSNFPFKPWSRVTDAPTELLPQSIMNPTPTNSSPFSGLPFKFRLPGLAKPGKPYPRSIQQSHALPRNQPPDPGLIFDTRDRPTPDFRDVHLTQCISASSSAKAS